jgi:PhnB protein
MSDRAPRGAPPPGYHTVLPYLLYEDADKAVAFLEAAFGFVRRETAVGAAGRNHHELVLGDDGLVMLGQAWPGFQSARALAAYPSATVHVYIDDVEALHRRAVAAGADVTDIELAPVGDRRFTATDPEGQVWFFAQRVAEPK